jgi:Starter unit:ACP transacylase in aflatoxin biosynthesis
MLSGPCANKLPMLSHYEAQNLDYDLPRRKTTLTGMSIGLFAAAAASVSSSLSELAYAGAESVRVAFRFCVQVDQVSQLLEPRGAEGNLRSWAYVVTGLSAEDVQRELDLYNAETVRPAPTP